MIQSIEMFEAICDKCGGNWDNGDGLMAFTSKGGIAESIEESEWKTGEEMTPAQPSDKCFCTECYHMNDEDEYVLNND